jgi:hypothetical protein
MLYTPGRCRKSAVRLALFIAASCAAVVLGGLLLLSQERRDQTAMVPARNAEGSGDQVSPTVSSAERGSSTTTPGVEPVEPSLAEVATPEDNLQGIELETDYRKSELRILKFRLREFRALRQKNPFGVTEVLLMNQSIANVLDSIGRYDDSPKTEKVTWSGKEEGHFFLHNDRAYRFSRGEFPEYDAWSDHYRDLNAHAALVKSGIKNTAKPTFDGTWFGQMEARAEEALSALK